MYPSDQQHRICKEGGGGGAGEDCGSRSVVKRRDIGSALVFQNVRRFLYAGKKTENKLKTEYDKSRDRLIDDVFELVKAADRSGLYANHPNLHEDLVEVLKTNNLVDKAMVNDMAQYLISRVFVDAEEDVKEDTEEDVKEDAEED
jgi:hypothetical protein